MPFRTQIRILCGAIALLCASQISQQAFAQSEPGHVYSVTHYKAHTGSEIAYTQAWNQSFLPLLDRMVEEGTLVSYLNLWKSVGDVSDATHVTIMEFSGWDSFGDLGTSLDAASQEVFGRPYFEVRAEAFFSLRDVIRNEVYVSPPADGL